MSNCNCMDMSHMHGLQLARLCHDLNLKLMQLTNGRMIVTCCPRRQPFSLFAGVV